jgi:hypothetical protein
MSSLQLRSSLSPIFNATDIVVYKPLLLILFADYPVVSQVDSDLVL